MCSKGLKFIALRVVKVVKTFGFYLSISIKCKKPKVCRYKTTLEASK